MTPASPRSEGPPCRRKSTLICQECDRERRVDGGWRRRDEGDRVAIVCPACGHVLTRRPREVPSRARQPWKRLAASLGRLATGPAPLVRRLASTVHGARRVSLPRLDPRSLRERLPGRD